MERVRKTMKTVGRRVIILVMFSEKELKKKGGAEVIIGKFSSFLFLKV